MNSVSQGLRLWIRKLPIIAALVLTVWIPGNAFLVVTTYVLGDSMSESMAFRLPMLVEGVIGHLSVASVLFVAAQSIEGNHPRYGAALNFGFSNWGRMFITHFVANLIAMLGILCLIIPGIVILVRYSFISCAVVLDGEDGLDARQKSWDLVPKVWVKVVGLGIIFLITMAVLSASLYLAMNALSLNIPMSNAALSVGEFLIACFSDIVASASTVIMFFLYKEAGGQAVLPRPPTIDAKIESGHLDYKPDDGNPFSPPRFS